MYSVFPVTGFSTSDHHVFFLSDDPKCTMFHQFLNKPAITVSYSPKITIEKAFLPYNKKSFALSVMKEASLILRVAITGI